MSVRKAVRMAVGISVTFLVIHVFLLFMFYKFGVMPMVYFNIFSICFYVFMTILCLKGRLLLFEVLVYLEVVLHMSLAAYFTGWVSGFQITLISMSIMMFYSEYISRHLKLPRVPSVPLCLVGMASYLTVCVLDRFHTAPYPLPETVVFYMQLFWGFLVFSITISSLAAFVKVTSGSEEILSREADHDQLTGIANRYYMQEQLEKLENSSKLDGCWVAMLDIDDFKNINDTYGHNCGDMVLKEIARILSEKREGISVCRWGGEEFLILGEGQSESEGVDHLNRIRKAIGSRRLWYEDKSFHIQVTIGMAMYRDNVNLSEWIGAADRKLYEGKHSGKNRVVA